MFVNESLLNFSSPATRAALQDALSGIDARVESMTLVALPIVDGREIDTQAIVARKDPAHSETILGTIHYADTELASEAIRVLQKGSRAWRDTPMTVRAKLLEDAAERMRKERHYLTALIIREAAKPWREADADIAEAIDFCRYYAGEAMRMAYPTRTSDIPGEEDFYYYEPKGIAAVISPWNFPLAITCGMTVAALVTGNTVLLKPAEQTSLIAYEFAKLLFDVGVPKDALAFLPGLGESLGRYLVNHPDVNLIAFTGSKNVGLEILATCAVVKPEQRDIKSAVIEMGGKNAIIVDEDADLDEATKAVLHSAFGYSGQKCSACSRLIAVGGAYEQLIQRLCEATADLVIGPASDPATILGPVIDEEARERLLNVILRAEKECTVALKGRAPSGGSFVPPLILKDVPQNSQAWREELFGPILACRKAKDFSEAIALANDSEYALTGSIFSRSPQNLSTGKKQMRAGNLYINRGCTGALVGRQPFGGYGLSGTGSKAGGPDYLLHFVRARTITENTMRRGFAPD